MNKSILFFTLAILVLSICACNGASSNISDNTLTSLQTMQAVVTQSPTAAQTTSIPETTPSVETDSVSVPDIPTDYVSITDFDCGDGYEDTNIFEIGPIAIIDNYMSDVAIGVMTYRNSNNTKTTKFELTVCGNEIIGGKEKYNAISAFLFSGSVSDILIENNLAHGFPKLTNIRTDPNKKIFVNR